MAKKTEAMKRPRVDWEAVEREYRAGVRSLKDVGDEFHVSAPAIVQRAKKYGWVRDLSTKIKQAAENKVNAKLVNAEVNIERAINDRQIVEANAAMIADKVINQRADIQRARAVVQRLWDAIATEVDAPEEFKRMGDMMRSPDQFGTDRLNDAYLYAVSLPQQVKSVKLLADALKTLIELERKVLKIDTTPDPEDTAKGVGEAITKGFGEATKAFRDGLLADLAGTDD